MCQCSCCHLLADTPRCLLYTSVSVSVCDRLRRGPGGVGRLRRPRPPEAGSSQSGVNVRGEQEKGCLTDGGLTWKTCPLFRVQQSADDRYLFHNPKDWRGSRTHTQTHTNTVSWTHFLSCAHKRSGADSVLTSGGSLYRTFALKSRRSEQIQEQLISSIFMLLHKQQHT